MDGEAAGDILHVLFVAMDPRHDDQPRRAAGRSGAGHVGGDEDLVVAGIRDVMGTDVRQGIDPTGRQNRTRHGISPGRGCAAVRVVVPTHDMERALHATTAATPCLCAVRLVLIFSVFTTGRRGLLYSAPPSRSWRKKSSSSCIS